MLPRHVFTRRVLPLPLLLRLAAAVAMHDLLLRLNLVAICLYDAVERTTVQRLYEWLLASCFRFPAAEKCGACALVQSRCRQE